MPSLSSSALASDMIWREICQIEKPIVASMGDIAASGGYYISMGCDKIYAEPGTLTGSIGVVSGKLVMKKMFGKVGVTTDVIARGKNSGLFSVEEKFTDSERAVMTKFMEESTRGERVRPRSQMRPASSVGRRWPMLATPRMFSSSGSMTRAPCIASPRWSSRVHECSLDEACSIWFAGECLPG